MAGGESSNPSPNQKPYGVNNIKTYVPLILDLNELTYDVWRELFLTHCRGFGVLDILNGKSTPKDDKDEDWYTLDALVKSWIYGTLTQPLLTMILQTDATAKAVWDSLEALFRDNKHSRSIELENELRSMVLGDQTITQFCSRFKAITDLLNNIGAPVPEQTQVTMLSNAIASKFEHVAFMLRHKQPPPTFLEARSILLVEETVSNRTRPTQPGTQRSLIFAPCSSHRPDSQQQQ